jgi:hypothetical protein
MADGEPSAVDRRDASHSSTAEPTRTPTPRMNAAATTRSRAPAARRHAHPASASRARPARPARRSRITVARGGATPAARSRKRNDLYASPPKPVGKNALKKVPTKVRRTRSEGGNASPRGRRNSCQRNAFTTSPASSTRNASATSPASACRSESMSACASARTSRRTTISIPATARRPIRMPRPRNQDRLVGEDGMEFSMTGRTVTGWRTQKPGVPRSGSAAARGWPGDLRGCDRRALDPAPQRSPAPHCPPSPARCR